MKLQCTAESLCNLFRTTLMMRENVKSLTLSFSKKKEQVNVLMEITALSDDNIIRHFDNLMKKTLTLKKTKKAIVPKGNAYKFSAEYFDDVKRWLRAMPQKKIHSITITFNEKFPYVEVLVYMPEHIRLNDIRDYLQWVEDGHVMRESVQRIQHYTGKRNEFSKAIQNPLFCN